LPSKIFDHKDNCSEYRGWTYLCVLCRVVCNITYIRE
jgi:hypothetical protein